MGEEDEIEEVAQPVRKLTKKQLKKLKEKEAAAARRKADEEAEAALAAAAAADEEMEEEEEDEIEEVAQPVKKLTKKQLKKMRGKEAAVAIKSAEKETNEVLTDNEDLDDLAAEVETKLQIDNNEDGKEIKKKKKDK